MGCGPSTPAGRADEVPHSAAKASPPAVAPAPVDKAPIAAEVSYGGGKSFSGGNSDRTVLRRGLENLEPRYELMKVVGRGQFGTTWLVTDKQTGQLMACKSIAKRKLTCMEDVEDVRREVQIMHHLKGHPNITYLDNVIEDRTAVHLIMRLCSGGELFDRITAKGHFSEADAARHLRTIIGAVAHCHSMGVMHRDLKPENFLLDNPSEDAALRCTDFGLSVFFKPGQVFKDVVGSAYYVAPEVLHHRYGPQADIWSCGVMLYILLSGMPPFWGENEKEIFDCILKGDLDFETEPWPTISTEAKNCVASMLTQSPRQRARAEDLLKHPWMRENGVASDKPLDDAIITRLGTFATHNKLKREAMRVIASDLPAEEIAGLQSIFEAIDKDRSGTITADELRIALAQKGAVLRPDDLKLLVSLIDVDASGTIDYEEFIAATLSQHQLLQEEHMLRAFRHFDRDNSGTITPDEIRHALAGERGVEVSDKEIQMILAEVDKDNDNLIDYNEFCEMMHKSQSSALKVADIASKTRGSLNPYKASKVLF